MAVQIKPSDLYYRYARKKEGHDRPRFSGPPDPRPFDRDDLYEVIPMCEAVMDALGSTDGRVLRQLEEILVRELPFCVESREEVFACLLGALRELLAD